jgi:signal transduction histidine kinase
LWARVVERNETVVVPNLLADLPAPQTLYPAEFPTYIGVPIHTTGRVLGVLSVFGEAIQKFSAEDIALLAAIANHVGVAVESAQLRQRAEQAAVVEERQRLARDLHDSVTQFLFGLTLFAEAGQDSARAADLTRVQHYLGRMAETAQQALKGMRLLIYELHPPALAQEGLVGALRQRLEAVEGRAGVEPQLLVDAPLEMPASVEADLYRIAQEALNNVIKHSAATQVTVRLGADEGRLQLEVTDNGQGFDLKAVGDQGGIGLVGMQERVERLGGSLHIVSELGQGTSIKVSVPLVRSK